MSTVLIIGGTGQLGSEICREFSDCSVLAPSHSELPIENSDAVRAQLEKARPDLVINCSAFHKLEDCQADPERAFSINALSVGALSRLCAAQGVAFATIGTDYVFSGELGRPYDELDAARPLNVYGISKLAGEQLAMAANPRCFVFRISGVFGRTGFSNKGLTFVELMISKVERAEPITVVDNIVFSPSYTVDVAHWMRMIIEKESRGLFHIPNSGQCSWYELALEALRCAGLSADVQRTQYENTPGGIARPMYSAMSHGELKRRGYETPPSWQSAVAAYVAGRNPAAIQAARSS